ADLADQIPDHALLLHIQVIERGDVAAGRYDHMAGRERVGMRHNGHILRDDPRVFRGYVTIRTGGQATTIAHARCRQARTPLVLDVGRSPWTARDALVLLPGDARIPAYRRASLDAFQQGQCVASQQRRIDALVRGQIRPEFDQGLTQLANRARRVATLAVIGAYGYVNQRLQEEPAGAAFRG